MSMVPLAPSSRRAALVLLSAGLLAGCASRPAPRATAGGGAAARRAPADPVPPTQTPLALDPAEREGAVAQALLLINTPYTYGGNTPQGGFDCSGLIAWVYRTEAGLQAPRTVAALQGWGQPLPADQLRSGDLVLFGNGGPPTHAGIYVGEGRFVHAPSTGGQVRMDRLDARHWARQQLSYRRP